MVNISHITQPGEAPNDRMPDGSEVLGSGTDRRDSHMHNRITDVSELSHGLGSHCLNACSRSRIPANRRLALILLYSLNGNSSTEHISAPLQSEMSSEAVCRSVQGSLLQTTPIMKCGLQRARGIRTGQVPLNQVRTAVGGQTVAGICCGMTTTQYLRFSWL